MALLALTSCQGDRPPNPGVSPGENDPHKLYDPGCLTGIPNPHLYAEHDGTIYHSGIAQTRINSLNTPMTARVGRSYLSVATLSVEESGIKLPGDEPNTWMRGGQTVGPFRRIGVDANISVGTPPIQGHWHSGFVDLRTYSDTPDEYCIYAGVIYQR